MIQPQTLMAEVEDALVPQLPIPVLRRLFQRARNDSWIAFGSRRKTRRHGVAPHYEYTVRKDELETWLPMVLQHELQNTKYVAPNTMGKQALRHWHPDPDRAPARDPEDYRQAIQDGKPIYFQAFDRRVRELSGLVLDLDFYKVDGLTAPLAIGVVLQMVDDGDLPQPAFAATSGRGLYLWWLLRDADGYAPERTVESEHVWRMVLDELWRRTKGLGADPRAKRLLQWVKAPGTTDTKTGNEVRYMTFGMGPLATVPEYELPELVDTLALRLAPTLADPTPQLTNEPVAELLIPSNKGPGWQPGCPGNPYAVHQARVRDLQALASHRGGIYEPHRHHALVCFYRSRLASYRAYKMGALAVEKAEADTRAFAAGWCRPTLPDGEVAKAFKSWSRERIYKPRTTTIVDQLGVTDDECRDLKLETLVTKTVKAERRQDQLAGKAGVADLTAEIDKLLLPPHSLTTRAIQKATRASRGRVMRRRKRLVEAGKLTGRDDRGSAPGQTKIPV